MALNIYYNKLKIYWESKGYKNASMFAKALGYSRAENIKRLERSKTAKPGLDILEAIVDKYPDFDLNIFVKSDAASFEKWHDKIHNILRTGIDLVIDDDKSEKHELKEPKVTTYSCPNCITKQKEVDKLNKELKIVQAKYIDAQEELLESYRGKRENQAPTGT